MAPTPHRIAQTSTELKKLAKKNGPRLNERQQKQFEREAELEQRAARARKAEESRKAAKKKREEKEAKEARARQQIGVGLATQLAGYSHTQAQL
jgi:tRNA nucleotidyltransferase (CCA-adding enzyme)